MLEYHVAVFKDRYVPYSVHVAEPSLSTVHCIQRPRVLRACLCDPQRCNYSGNAASHAARWPRTRAVRCQTLQNFKQLGLRTTGRVTLTTRSCAAGDLPYAVSPKQTAYCHPESANRRFTPPLAILYHVPTLQVICAIQSSS